MDLVAQYYFAQFGLDDEGAITIINEAFNKSMCSPSLFVYQFIKCVQYQIQRTKGAPAKMTKGRARRRWLCR